MHIVAESGLTRTSSLHGVPRSCCLALSSSMPWPQPLSLPPCGVWHESLSEPVLLLNPLGREPSLCSKSVEELSVQTLMRGICV